MQFILSLVKAISQTIHEFLSSEPILPTHYTESNKPLKNLIINA